MNRMPILSREVNGERMENRDPLKGTFARRFMDRNPFKGTAILFAHEGDIVKKIRVFKETAFLFTNDTVIK